MLSAMSGTIERQTLSDATYMWNLKNNTVNVYESIAKYSTIETDSQRYREQTSDYQKKGEGQIKGVELTDTNYYV